MRDAWPSGRRSDRAVETPTRMELFIEPHRGIGPVSFGMTRAEVAVVMDAIGGGSPIPRGMNVDCFFDNSFQIAFGDAGHADFIEISSSMPVPVLYSGRAWFKKRCFWVAGASFVLHSLVAAGL